MKEYIKPDLYEINLITEDIILTSPLTKNDGILGIGDDVDEMM